MTFDELFKEHNLTPAEKADLIEYLANIRAKATRKALSQPSADALWFKAHLHELRQLLDRRPAINAGLVESYQKWTAEVYALDWLNALDAPSHPPVQPLGAKEQP